MATETELCDALTGRSIDYEVMYNDLKDEHDALLQRSKTMMLEKQQYELELSQQTDLIDHYESQHSSSIDNLELASTYSNSLHSMSSALHKSDTLREAMTDEVSEYKQINRILKKENDKLKTANKRYQETLETIRNIEHKKELEYQYKIQILNKEIEMIKKEEINIYEKYDEKVSAYDTLKNELETKLEKRLENKTKDVVIDDDKSFIPRWGRRRTLSTDHNTFIPKQPSANECDVSFFSNSSLQGLAEGNEDHFHEEPNEAETEVLMEDMMKIIQQKEAQIKEITIKLQRKDEEIEKVNTFNDKLKNENKNLMIRSKQNECQSCVGFKWFSR